MTKKKRYLRPWIQTILEVNVFLIMGFFCSLTDFDLKMSVILSLIVLLLIMVVSAIALIRYGRYPEDV